MGYQRILVFADTGRLPFEALELAMRLAVSDDSVHLLVASPIVDRLAVLAGGGVEIERCDDLEALRQKLSSAGYGELSLHVVEGASGPAVLGTARAMGADLIVLSGVEVDAERIVREAPCPVFVWRPAHSVEAQPASNRESVRIRDART